MNALLLTSLLLTANDPSAGAGWSEAAKDDGITVSTRQKEGASVHEVKAQGSIDAPPEAVWKVLRDFGRYNEVMPYTEQSKVLSDDGKKLRFYSVVNAPLVSRRDYVIEVTDASEWNEGKGFLMTQWTAVPDAAPLKSGIVRVKVNDGFWKLEPRDDGKKTFATYYLYTDPAGSLPKFIVNRANGSAVPDVFRAVRKEVAKRLARN